MHDAEFDTLIARAGIDIPPDHREAIVAAYPELRDAIALLHRPRPATSEPANIFAMHARDAAK